MFNPCILLHIVVQSIHGKYSTQDKGNTNTAGSFTERSIKSSRAFPDGHLPQRGGESRVFFGTASDNLQRTQVRSSLYHRRHERGSGGPRGGSKHPLKGCAKKAGHAE